MEYDAEFAGCDNCGVWLIPTEWNERKSDVEVARQRNDIAVVKVFLERVKRRADEYGPSLYATTWGIQDELAEMEREAE